MIINSESDYLIACGQLDELVSHYTSEDDAIVDELAIAIEAFEDANYPMSQTGYDPAEHLNE